ncbi:molybdopterin-dependent oxidoreductase [Nocardioides daphniae]|uniref:Oxidoreductase n=1 Tax=Nocardioides daphniae TaxID=402297 RepID=A0A4P7UB93_9ACTN|nr:molybdopterin-dependent oxidoreductase [Nocardioides daphniae]QCC76199.1 oxidoreductase [Nocardioides daphniae]GGD09054.1 oxidoreductase [Nocardioides daphniae]
MQTPTRATARHALHGVVATCVGIALAHLVAALTVPDASPVYAVGSTVVDLTPTPVKEWAVAELGTADKAVLLGSVVAVVLLLAALAGVVARRRPTVGAVALVVLASIGTAAAVARPGAGPAALLPGVAAAVSGAGVLLWLVRLDARTGAVAAASSAPSRRGVLLAGAGLAAVAAGLAAGGEWLVRRAQQVADVVLPAASDPAGPFPRGLEETVPGITPLRTPTSDFYRIDTRLMLPRVDLDQWSLTIDGDVEREVSFTFDELTAMPLTERDITLTCVSNEVGGPYVGSARWLGVPLGDLLARAGIEGTSADQILSTDVDGMTISTPLRVALDGRDSMIAIGMNGSALPLAHGFPARMVVPGLYGFVSACKWITRMTLTTYDEQQAYWTERDWATDAPIRISSRIDTPRALADEKAGELVIGGVAWAQHVGIESVEVRIDGQAWRTAELGPDVGDDHWRQWYLPWQAEEGTHYLACRARGKDGTLQESVRRTPFPSGSSGIQEIAVTVS